MQRKIFIHRFRVFAIVFLLLSFLSIVAVRLSDKGDIVDRNADWILLVFLISLLFFIYSIFISDDSSKQIHKKRTTNQLINEIKKSNIDRLKDRKKQDT
jgi:hypothetical protein